MSRKVKVTVFLPVGVCGCSQSSFLSRVYEAVRRHWDVVEYRESTAESDEAKAAGVSYRGVLVGTHLLQSNPTTDMIEAAIVEQMAEMGATV